MSQNELKGKLVLVTGGAGFLGSHLIESLVARGAKIWVLDCLEEPSRLKGVRDRIHYVKTDVTNWVSEGKESFEFIFHLAAFAFPHAVQGKPELAFRQNVMATVNMLEMARKFSVKKFIFTSAGALYTGMPKYLPIDEAHPIDPSQSVYATTKRIGELLCDDFRKNYGVPSLYFRLFNTYGPRQSGEYLVPSFFGQAFSKGTLTIQNDQIKRDFTYVGDIVEALIRGAESEYSGGPINLGSGREHSIGEVARKIASLMKVEKVECLNQEVFGPKRHVCNNTLARQILNWQPACSLDEGLQRTYESFKDELLLAKR